MNQMNYPPPQLLQPGSQQYAPQQQPGMQQYAPQQLLQQPGMQQYVPQQLLQQPGFQLQPGMQPFIPSQQLAAQIQQQPAAASTVSGCILVVNGTVYHRSKELNHQVMFHLLLS